MQCITRAGSNIGATTILFGDPLRYSQIKLILKIYIVGLLQTLPWCEAVSQVWAGPLIWNCAVYRNYWGTHTRLGTGIKLSFRTADYYSWLLSVAVTSDGGAWQAECQSCPLISQECPTPAPGPDYYLLHSWATCLLQVAYFKARSVEMWAGGRPNSLPTPVSELSITKPTLGSLPRASKQPVWRKFDGIGWDIKKSLQVFSRYSRWWIEFSSLMVMKVN